MTDLYVLINSIGTIGLILLLTGFFLEETGRAGKKHCYYNVLNLVGSALLIAYAWYFSTWIFVILNGAWVMIALYYIIKNMHPKE